MRQFAENVVVSYLNRTRSQVHTCIFIIFKFQQPIEETDLLMGGCVNFLVKCFLHYVKNGSLLCKELFFLLFFFSNEQHTMFSQD